MSFWIIDLKLVFFSDKMTKKDIILLLRFVGFWCSVFWVNFNESSMGSYGIFWVFFLAVSFWMIMSIFMGFSRFVIFVEQWVLNWSFSGYVSLVANGFVLYIYTVFGWGEFRKDGKHREENRVKNSIFHCLANERK